MPKLQGQFVALLRQALDDDVLVEEELAPAWLVRPGRQELGRHWGSVRDVYGELTGLVLPEVMPPRERRRLDVILTYADGTRRVVEFDESQHFTAARTLTLARYGDVAVAFDVAAWRQRCDERIGREPGGGFARPRPPLFPDPGGRHRQRAFRDVLADVLPLEHGWAPTMRVSDQELKLIVTHDRPVIELRSLIERKQSSAD